MKKSANGVGPEPGGRHKNAVDGPRAKTTDAGECPEWGKGHGDICGDHMTPVFGEKVDFGMTFWSKCAKTHTLWQFQRTGPGPTPKNQ